MTNRNWILLIGGLLAACCLASAFFFFRREPMRAALQQTGYEADIWMHVRQHDRKVGYSHTRLQNRADERLLSDTLFLRMNAMGLVQDVRLNTKGLLNRDFSIRSLDFDIMTDRPLFAVEGEVRDRSLILRMMAADSENRLELPLTGPIYLPSAIPFVAAASFPKPGAILHYDVFNPSELAIEKIEVRILDAADESGAPVENARYRLRATRRGLTQDLWIDNQGEILRETDALGFQRERDSRYEVRFGALIQDSEDVARSASLPSNMPIDAPETITRLRVRISGLPAASMKLDGGRQTMQDGLIAIEKEKIDSSAEFKTSEDLRAFLQPTPFIQSDHPRIRSLAAEIVGAETDPTAKIRRMVDWIRAKIAPQPVLTVPDALCAVTRLTGDCNDHAVLLAALARAAGIPSGIEAGLVYANGRFFYHAWNSVYVGNWITADALSGQLPADVTHIRLIGGPDVRYAELIGLVSRLRIEVVDYR